MNAVRGQVERATSDYLEAVFLYDGPLSTAIQQHLGQGVLDKMSTFAFIALSNEAPIQVAASGMPINSGILIDVNVIVRAQGVSRYEEDLQRLFDAVDCVAQETFCNDCKGMSQEYRDVVQKTTFVSRTRLDTGEALLAHAVRFQVKV